MKRPFTYGKLANEVYFTNRQKESNWVEMQIEAGINCMLISPRRWGKSSLIQHVASRMQKKNTALAFCFVDLYNVRTEQEFLQLYSSAIIKATADSFETAVKNVKTFFKQLIPTIAVSSDPLAEIELSFNWKQLKQDFSEVLDLPEKIARKKKIQLIVCVDEFQNISFTEDGIAFQKKAKGTLAKTPSCNLCFVWQPASPYDGFFYKKQHAVL